MKFTARERDRILWAAMQQQRDAQRLQVRGELHGHGRVMFYPVSAPRLRVEQSYDEMTSGQADREFLKVNRIAGSGL